MKFESAKWFTNIELVNKELDILADITIHLKDGIIDHIEIWNKTGVDYPLEELLTYELRSISETL